MGQGGATGRTTGNGTKLAIGSRMPELRPLKWLHRCLGAQEVRVWLGVNKDREATWEEELCRKVPKDIHVCRLGNKNHLGSGMSCQKWSNDRYQSSRGFLESGNSQWSHRPGGQKERDHPSALARG